MEPPPERIAELGHEVEELAKRVDALRTLKENIDASAAGTFTSEEKAEVVKRLNEATSLYAQKKKSFRQRLDVYEERVQKISRVIQTRGSVIDRVCSTTLLASHPDLMEIFEKEHDTLESELQKSIDFIEEKEALS